VLATTAWDLIAEHAGSFLAGALVGLVASSRYRIVRVRNGNGKEETDAS
jgi:hypothetical protein